MEPRAVAPSRRGFRIIFPMKKRTRESRPARVRAARRSAAACFCATSETGRLQHGRHRRGRRLPGRCPDIRPSSSTAPTMSWMRRGPRSPLGGRGRRRASETLGEMVAAELARLPLSMRERPVYASDALVLRGEGRRRLTLNLDDLARYEKPRILMAGDRKIGVVAVDYYASARQLEKLHDEPRVRRRRVLRLPRAASELPCEHRRLQRGHRHRRRPRPFSAAARARKRAHRLRPGARAGGVVLLTSLNVPSSKVYASLWPVPLARAQIRGLCFAQLISHRLEIPRSIMRREGGGASWHRREFPSA